MPQKHEIAGWSDNRSRVMRKEYITQEKPRRSEGLNKFLNLWEDEHSKPPNANRSTLFTI